MIWSANWMWPVETAPPAWLRSGVWMAPRDRTVKRCAGAGARLTYVIERRKSSPDGRDARVPSGAHASEQGSGAGDGVRTRDIQLGKLTLCQLSYSRSGEPGF